jgi:monoamine oxidase
MARPRSEHIIIIGAGAAGLMAARELAQAGRRVTILEARGRCGGRIHPLAASAFGYPAEGGAEFVHGEAPVTRGLLREAGLETQPIEGARWRAEQGAFSQGDAPDPHSERLQRLLAELTTDLTVADFVNRHFAGAEFSRLRHSILRMAESYDAADPNLASMLALRDEWTSSSRGTQARIIGGYGALIDFLAAECRKLGALIHLGAAVRAIETIDDRALVRCADDSTHTGDAAILTVPPPLLQEIQLPPAAREKAAAAADIGFGNVIKFVLRFKTRWWAAGRAEDFSDLLFLLSDAAVPVWWTQHPAEHPVLTGWLAGPRTKGLENLDEGALIEMGIGSLAAMFGLTAPHLKAELVAARAINWALDPFARGAYSYTTLATPAARSALADGAGPVLFSGEALYRGREMGTVEAALASGRSTAESLLRR